jgi:hypothetical protein
MRLALVITLFASVASAQDLRDRFNIRIGLTGMYLAEQDNGSGVANVSSPLQLAFGDLRIVMDARRLPGKFELHLDGRVRVTGQFSEDAATIGTGQTTARGYLGGREYEIRQAWVARRGEKIDFGIGRLVVAEADAMKIDGVRLWWRMVKHWDVSAYAGAYPDPYSRSVTSDYLTGDPGNLNLRGVFAFAGGVDTTYTYDRVWGAVSVNAAYLGGKDDGGPFNPANPAGKVQDENVRAFMTWTSFERFTSWLDVYHDLVLDFAGAAGVQLTRLDIFANLRAPKYFSLRLGYDHMSALAIETYLTRLLANRVDFLAGTIENNLVINRTARDEGRANLDFTIAKVSIWAEGRVRHRALVDTKDDTQFVVNGDAIAPSLAYDFTLGVRDRGSLKDIRLGVWYTFIGDYRAQNHIFSFELGRSFLDERLSVDVMFLYANTRDNGVGQACAPGVQLIASTCWGTRAGDEYEGGLTVTGLAWKHWFGLLDYRILADTETNSPAKVLLTHMLVFRIEARY